MRSTVFLIVYKYFFLTVFRFLLILIFFHFVWFLNAKYFWMFMNVGNVWKLSQLWHVSWDLGLWLSQLLIYFQWESGFFWQPYEDLALYKALSSLRQSPLWIGAIYETNWHNRIGARLDINEQQTWVLPGTGG